MSDETRAAIDAAQASRKAAKDAYDKARDRIEPLRIAWINADAEVRRLMASLNTTKAATWRD